MSHDHAPDVSVMFTQEFWDERYGSVEAVWSGNPNQRLVEEVADLVPGTALEVGCGEGADAIWLATRGWRVTGLDVSAVALERAAARAAAAGGAIAERITWQRADLLAWKPGDQRYDLVSAQFMQLPPAQREVLHRRLAEAVGPGGSLLIVAHDPSDLHTAAHRPHSPDLFFTADQVAATLDPARWEILVAAAPERQMTGPDGEPVTIRDAVLHARRRH